MVYNKTLEMRTAWLYTVLNSYSGCVKAVSIFWVRNSLWTCRLVSVHEKNFILWLPCCFPSRFALQCRHKGRRWPAGLLPGLLFGAPPARTLSLLQLTCSSSLPRGYNWFPLLPKPEWHKSFPSCPGVRLVLIICLGGRLLTVGR